MKIEYYDYLFYIIYKYYKKKYMEVNKWYLAGIILWLSLFEMMPLFVLIEIILKFQNSRISMVYFKIGLPLIFCILNSLYFLKKSRWITIIEKPEKYEDITIFNLKYIIPLSIIILSVLFHLYLKVIAEWRVYE